MSVPSPGRAAPPGAPVRTRAWRRAPNRGPPDEGPRRQHAPGRADRLPRDPHVGAALPGRDDARRLHGRRGAGVEPVALDLGRRLVRGLHADARRGEARARLRSGRAPGHPRCRRQEARALHPPDRGVHPGVADPRAHQGRDVRERLARPAGGRSDHRALPRLVLGPRRAARAHAPAARRRARLRARARAPGAAAVGARRRGPAGLGKAARLPRRGDPLPRAHRDPAHYRLGHDGVGQDRADRGPRRPDPRPRRALRPLRQDGHLHPRVLRPRPRRADESARCPRAALVALL